MSVIDTTSISSYKHNAELAIPHIVEAIDTAFNEAQTVTPDDAQGTGNTILPSSVHVSVAANTNDANDFVVLPALSSVPAGHTITVVGNTAGFEVRTPASSGEEINSEDCDGTKEYAVAANKPVVRFTKIDNTIGWMGQGFTAIGGVISAVVPD